MDPACQVFHYAPGDLRGAEGLPAGGRPDRDVPAEANAARFDRSARRMAHARAAGGRVRPGDRAAGNPGPGLGAGRRARHSLYLRPFMIATHVGPGRQQAVVVLPVRGHRLAGRRLLRRRRAARFGLAGRRTISGPRPAAPARPRPAGTTQPASSASCRRWRTAATRWSGSTRRSIGGSRKWAG